MRNVSLKFDVKENGRVENIRVVKGIPEGIFDESAKRALAKWKYDAGGISHKNVSVQLDYKMN